MDQNFHLFSSPFLQDTKSKSKTFLMTVLWVCSFTLAFSTQFLFVIPLVIVHLPASLHHDLDSV